MARWASLVEQKRQEQPVLLVDTGDFYAPRETADQETKDRCFFRAMKLLQYDAVAIGEYETRIGLDELARIARGYTIPLVCSNIVDRERKKPIAPTSIVREIGGRPGFFGRRGAVRVGILSAALPGYIYRYGAADRYYVIDPRLAALETAMKLRADGCDLVVALSHSSWERSLDFAKDVPGIDIVLNSHGSHEHTYEERVGTTVVIDSGPKEYSFTEVDVTFRGDSLDVKAADKCKELLARPGDPRFLALEERCAAELKRPSPRKRPVPAKSGS
jgi:2',3'-cyclic-nucleotide 2'-phosphodiesterase (5'-nucleotidase family)